MNILDQQILKCIKCYSNARFLDKNLLENDWKKERPLWTYSCYATGKYEKSLLLGFDLSQEEIRFDAYKQLKNGSLDKHIQLLKFLDGKINQEMDRIFNQKGYIDRKSLRSGGFEDALNNPNVALQGQKFGGVNSGFAGSASGFGNSSIESNAFGTPRSGVFANTSVATGFGQQSAAQTASVFGQPSSAASGFGTTVFGSTSLQQGGFGQQQASVFGSSAPQKSMTANAFGQQSSVSSTFGQQSLVSSGFGSSAFGQQSIAQNSFGSSVPSQSAPPVAFGQQPTSSFGSSGFGLPAPNAFGNSMNQSASAQVPMTSSFGSNGFQGSNTGNQGLSTNNVFSGNQALSSFGNNTSNTTSNSTAMTGTSFPTEQQSTFGSSSFGFQNTLGTSNNVVNNLNQTNSGFGTEIALSMTNISEGPVDPISAFKADKFIYGKIPEIEPPEGLC